MDNDFLILPMKTQLEIEKNELLSCNQMTARFGLALSGPQIQTLAEHHFYALQNTGRVEFGEGILKKLIYAFCDSPYLFQDNYENTLLALQDLFYDFKNESMDRLSDDELIEAMKTVFNNKAHGSLDYLSGASPETLYRAACGEVPIEEAEIWEEEDD
ncbi:MAG: DUF6323 family protein [Oscillospiraceae bacterium]